MSTETQTAVPVVGCVAALDDVIRERLPGLRAGDVVAQWSGGEEIVVEGHRPSRGWTAAIFRKTFVRWSCAGKGGKGWFGLGLTEVPEGAVGHLPVVR